MLNTIILSMILVTLLLCLLKLTILNTSLNYWGRQADHNTKQVLDSLDAIGEILADMDK